MRPFYLCSFFIIPCRKWSGAFIDSLKSGAKQRLIVIEEELIHSQHVI